jgi:LuxR family transcriptional regulator, activator of conjugal transfer of Ti plasmids
MRSLCNVQDLDQLNAAFSAALATVGCNNWAYQAKPPREDFDPIILTTYPAEWVNHYMAMRYDKIDPIVDKTESQFMPFIWEERLKDVSLTQKQKVFLQHASDFGLHNGIAIPIMGRQRLSGTVTIVPDINNNSLPQYFKSHRELLHTISLLYDSLAKDIMKGGMLFKHNKMTDREFECMRWLSRGKTYYEIAIILSDQNSKPISERTVKAHIESTKNKLGVYTRTDAINLFVN